jgi:aryl-alcohol dehydrogenase-like predicted oxidoreductase
MAGVEHFVSSQPQYSMLWRKPEEEVIPFCGTHGISQIVWSPLGQGVLTGKYQPGAAVPTDSRAASSTMSTAFRRKWLQRSVLDAVNQLRSLAAQAGLSVAKFADARVDPALFAQAEQILDQANAVEM